jgi:hypothetical protein
LIFDHPTTTALTEHLLAALGVAETSSVLDQLDRLEAVFDGGTSDPKLTATLAARLAALLAKCGRAAAGGDVADTLDSASDDEIFDFIDNTLGAH